MADLVYSAEHVLTTQAGHEFMLLPTETKCLLQVTCHMVGAVTGSRCSSEDEMAHT